MPFGERKKIAAIITEAIWHGNYEAYPWQCERNKLAILDIKERKRRAQKNSECAEGKLSFIHPEYPELHHLGLFTQLEKSGKEERFVRQMGNDDFYHPLRLSECLHTFFGLPPIYFRENQKKWRPRLAIIPMVWYHTVIISQAIHGELLFSEVSLSEKMELKERDLRTELRRRLGRYIENFSFLGTEKRKMMRTYHRVWGEFEQVELSPKPSKSELPHKDKKGTILGIEFHWKGSLKPDHGMLANILSETPKALQFFLRNVGVLQEVLGCWNSFLLLARAAISVLQNCCN